MSIAVQISPVMNDAQFFDNNGNVASGYYIWQYENGSFTNLQTTYTNSTGNVPNANPIQLDSSGRFPSGVNIWLIQGGIYNLTITSDAVGQNIVKKYEGITGSTTPSGFVSQINAGTNITISPTTGVGAVTISASGGGGSSNALILQLYSNAVSPNGNTSTSWAGYNVVQTSSDCSWNPSSQSINFTSPGSPAKNYLVTMNYTIVKSTNGSTIVPTSLVGTLFGRPLPYQYGSYVEGNVPGNSSLGPSGINWALIYQSTHLAVPESWMPVVNQLTGTDSFITSDTGAVLINVYLQDYYLYFPTTFFIYCEVTVQKVSS